MFRIPPAMDDSARARCDALIRLMENACSEMLLAPDWTLNMQIVDELNREQDPVVLSEVIRILRKRLGSQDIRVLSVSLTLVETLVKNCGAPVHREVASERFMAAMAKIVRTHSFRSRRESLSIADQALDIIQAWGEAFLPKRREFPLFVETYHHLRAEGLPFKEQYQPDRPPVLDPGAGSLLDRPASRSGLRGGGARKERGGKSGSGTPGETGSRGDGVSSPDEFATLSVSNREIVATGASCSEMLEQVLQAAESRAEVRKSDIAVELVEQLKATGPKIVRIIEVNGEGDPAMLGALFKVNDAVDNVLRLYKDVVDGVKPVPLLPPSRHSSGVDAVSKDMENLAVGDTAESSSKPGSVPTLSRPPSDKKGQRGKEKRQTQDPDGAGTTDLLSGFELEGASNYSVNASNRALMGGGAVPTTASTGEIFFAGFATPAAAAGTPAVRGGTGTVAAKGVVGSQAGAMAAGGQVTGQQAPLPLPQQQQQQQHQYPPQPALTGPKTSADKAKSLLDNLGALYAGGSSSRQIGVERMGSAGGLGTRTFPTFSEGGAGMATTSVSEAAWVGNAGVGGSQGLTAIAGGGGGTVASGAAQASPFDAMDSLGGQAPPQPPPQQPQQPFQQLGQEAHGHAGNSDQLFLGQEPFQGQAQDPFQYQPSQDQQQPIQPVQGYQQSQDFQQQPQGFQQPPQAFQQQSQGFQQQPEAFQSPQGLQQQQPQPFQPLPQGFQQQPPQGFQQQQPQSYQQQPQGFQQQPQNFQQQQSFYGQQPQGFQQPYQQQF